MIDKLKAPEFDEKGSRIEARSLCKHALEQKWAYLFVQGSKYQHSLLTKEIALRNRVIAELISRDDWIIENIVRMNGGIVQELIDERNKELLSIIEGV